MFSFSPEHLTLRLTIRFWKLHLQRDTKKCDFNITRRLQLPYGFLAYILQCRSLKGYPERSGTVVGAPVNCESRYALCDKTLTWENSEHIKTLSLLLTMDSSDNWVYGPNPIIDKNVKGVQKCSHNHPHWRPVQHRWTQNKMMFRCEDIWNSQACRKELTFFFKKSIGQILLLLKEKKIYLAVRKTKVQCSKIRWIDRWGYGIFLLAEIPFHPRIL